jgi:hypothetical protein
MARKYPGTTEFHRAQRHLDTGNVLCFPVARTPGRVDAEPTTLKAAERSHIRKILMQANGAISGPNGAPARLGLKPSTLYGRMQKLGIPLPTKNPLSSKMISCSSGSGFVCHEDQILQMLNT